MFVRDVCLCSGVHNVCYIYVLGANCCCHRNSKCWFPFDIVSGCFSMILNQIYTIHGVVSSRSHIFHALSRKFHAHFPNPFTVVTISEYHKAIEGTVVLFEADESLIITFIRSDWGSISMCSRYIRGRGQDAVLFLHHRRMQQRQNL